MWHCVTVALLAAVLVVLLPEMLRTPCHRGALLCPARVSRALVCVWDLLSVCLAQQLLSGGGCKQMLRERGNGAREGGRGLQSPCRGGRDRDRRFASLP